MKMTTGPIPVLGESDPGLPRQPDQGDPEVLVEYVQPKANLWIGRNAEPSKFYRDRTRSVLATLVAITSSLILMLTTVGMVFFGLSAETFVMVNGVSAAYLALSRVTSWYFTTRKGRRVK